MIQFDSTMNSPEKSRVNARKTKKLYLCCFVSASILSSEPGKWEQRKKGEVVLLPRLCQICNMPISLASIPARQLTNGGTLLKLRKMVLTPALSHRQHSTLLKISDCYTRNDSTDIHFLSVPCQCYLFAVIWYFSIWKPRGWRVCKQHGVITCII